MKIQDWGEDDFIAYLTKEFPFRSPLVGIGDDCALLPHQQLIKTDALVEGIHFIKEQIPPQELGYKLIAVNVSDIASKGGVPKYAFLTIAIPATTESAWLKDVIAGMREACTKWDIQLLGGDTVGSKRDLFLSLTLTGTSPLVKYRHQAQEGDLVCVTGYLGDSYGGLKALQENLIKTEEVQSLIRAHFHPEPSPAEGIWLSGQEGVHAMMDISDGLDIDLNRLIKASGCGAVIELEELPLSTPLLQTCLEHNWNPSELAATGGEDYCLLVTIAKRAYNSLNGLFYEKFGHPLFAIGQITDQKGPVFYHRKGQPIEMHLKHFDHFC